MTSNETCENTDAKKREFYFKFHHITLLSPVSDKRKEKNKEKLGKELRKKMSVVDVVYVEPTGHIHHCGNSVFYLQICKFCFRSDLKLL